MDFIPYPSIGDARLSTSSSVSNSNRSDYSSASASDGESVWSSSTVISVSEEKLFVAVDKKFDEGKSVLSWALQNSGGRKICLLHVHQPNQVAQEFNMMGGGGTSASILVKEQAEGRKRMQHLLNKYLLICSQAGVPVEKLQIETKLLIEEEIVKLISHYGIRWLVMGAASRTHFSRKMTDLKSKKAKHVNALAPVTCHIWFVCKDQLIYTRQGSLGVTNVDPVPEVQQPGPNPGTIRPDPVIVRSVTLGSSTQRNQISSSHNLHGRSVSEINVSARGSQDERPSAESGRIMLLKYIKERDELKKKGNELEKERNELEKERDELKKERDDLKKERGDLKKERDELKKERDESKNERDESKNERDELQIKLDNVLVFSQLFSEFSSLEIEEGTQSFDPSLKIVEGDYGTIYKGLLRHTEVAIKMLNTESLQAPSEYQREVDVLSNLRHPNIVTLIGACPDIRTLIYEDLPNGSLEDRLTCKDNSPPLSWQTRIRIATELFSALTFLHSSKPHSIVHGDIKPSNILLDANFVSKLSSFGICRVVSPDEHASIEATTSYRADPQELTTTSDVYSFGVVLLRLLTGKASVGITKEVRNALVDGKLKSVLDCSAGDWPYVQACQLAYLAVRCVEKYCENQPNLRSEVWRVLQAMRVSCGGFARTDEANPPHYFVCPIFQEVMQDPHVAADGFTYEADALKGWLDSGHDTSPMTNLKLAHTNLVPNLALRSAIQEWLHKQKV